MKTKESRSGFETARLDLLLVREFGCSYLCLSSLLVLIERDGREKVGVTNINERHVTSISGVVLSMVAETTSLGRYM